jgi:hypothetical protein
LKRLGALKLIDTNATLIQVFVGAMMQKFKVTDIACTILEIDGVCAEIVIIGQTGQLY